MSPIEMSQIKMSRIEMSSLNVSNQMSRIEMSQFKVIGCRWLHPLIVRQSSHHKRGCLKKKKINILNEVNLT